MSRRAVFLDRDGVLVREIVRDDGQAYAPTEIDAFHLVDDAAGEVERLRAAGFICVVVTNQPEVARGSLDRDVLDEMHRRLRASIPVDDLEACPHTDEDGCVCRKPRPGMLQSAAQRWDLDLATSFLVGDRWRDIEAGRAVGCATLLIERPYSNCTTADVCVQTLSEAVDWILDRSARNLAE
jgi:D-glycero-D-manno-heptose 1,7-bisphosphate phosphatase